MNPLNNQTFCIAPFVNFASTTNGPVHVCGRNYSNLGDTRKDDPIKIWNSAEFKELRKSFLNDEKHSSCSECWNLEAHGGVSKRAEYNSRWGHLIDLVECEADGTSKTPPYSIELLMSNLCNLSCRMCFPDVSTKVATTWKKAGIESSLVHWDNHGYQRSLTKEQVLNFLTSTNDKLYEVTLSGGEPLLDPDILSVISAIPRTTILRILTNATSDLIITDELITLLKEFSHVTWKLSVDGPPELNEYIRVGLKTKAFEDILERLKLVSDDMVMQTAFTIFNANRWYDTVSYIRTLGAKRFVISYGSHQINSRLLPEFMKREIVVQANRVMLSCKDSELDKDLAEASINIIAIMQQQWKNEWHHQNFTYHEVLKKVLEFITRLDAQNHTQLSNVNATLSDWINGEVGKLNA